MRRLLSLSTITLGLLASACSFAPPATTVTQYDLGPPPAGASPTSAALRIADVEAPASLDGTSMLYRLQYSDPYRPAAYRDSRWTAAPATLLGQRLRQAAAQGEGAAPAAGPARLVRVELDRFEQVFSAPGASRVVVQLRARVIDTATRTRAAHERSFVVERDAPSADAAGAARAMAAAVDEVSRQVLGWAGGLP
jgi:cholesterol transport system auxiliary component